MTRPVAYIRRSSADAGSPGDISREVQEHAVRELAARDGHDGDLRLYVDWARSADDEKEAKRTEYAAMIRAVEAGEVSAIFSYAMDRLHRSVTQTAKLVRACEEHRVRIVTTREGEVRHDTPDEWLRFTTLATFAEYELRTIKKRVEHAMERRRARGDVFGHAPYGYQHVRDDEGRIIRVVDDSEALRPVLAAVRDAGSVLGACRLLEQRGIPAPKGGARWSPSALTRILERDAPELLPRKGPAGRRTPTRSLLGQLLLCHCGTVMTPNVTRGQYYCNRGHVEGSAKHGKYNVREADLLPWIMAEAERLAPDLDVVRMGEETSRRREGLDAERERLGWAVVDGLLTREQAAAKAAEIDAELERLADQDAAIVVTEYLPIDWTKPPERINALLRALWEYVELGPDMAPVRAVWRAEDWRRM